MEEKKNDDLNDRLTILGKITAIVSHELRNPLGVIRSSVYVIKKVLKSPDEKVSKHLERIEKQIDICDKIVGELLEYTRDNKPEPSVCRLNDFLNEIIRDFGSHDKIEINISFSNKINDVSLVKEKIRRVIVNIMENSIIAIRQKMREVPGFNSGRIEIKTEIIDEKPVVIIEDNGSGMSKEILEKAFDPLVTTHSKGTGLGLFIVKKIIDDHGWEINVESKEGIGTKISLLIKE